VGTPTPALGSFRSFLLIGWKSAEFSVVNWNLGIVPPYKRLKNKYIGDVMKTIDLGHGFSTLVDEESYAKFSDRKWKRHPSGYACRDTSVNGKRKTLWLHRLILNPPEDLFVDHINGDPLDNRLENLRVATQTENARNRKNRKGRVLPKCVREETPGKAYRAYITVNKKYIGLGTFKTPEEAHQAYVEASKKYHGEFSNTG